MQMFNYFQTKCFISFNFTIMFCTKKQDAVPKMADIFYLLPLKLSGSSIFFFFFLLVSFMKESLLRNPPVT